MPEMNKQILDVLNALTEYRIAYALLDETESRVFLIVDSTRKQDLQHIFEKLKWVGQKNKRKQEIFLYGMDKFMDFALDNNEITICFQLACKSTMHGEWIPLDRKINDVALNRAALNNASRCVLENHVDLVYRVTKCVFTKGEFSQEDISIIEQYKELLHDPQTAEYLMCVFFAFTPTLLRMLELKDYANIVQTCFEFAEY